MNDEMDDFALKAGAPNALAWSATTRMRPSPAAARYRR